MKGVRVVQSSTAVYAEGLKKTYGATKALQGVDLSIEAGTILGYWSRRSASRIGDAVYYDARPQMLRRMIERCDTAP